MLVASLSVYNLQMLQWTPTIREGFGFRMRTITPLSIKTNDLEPLDVFRRGMLTPALTTATRSYAPKAQDPLPHESRGVAGVPTSSAIYTEGVRAAAPLLLRENNEYENTVDTIVQRTREQERIVREWDIEMERLLERQYRMNYDDVVREFNHKVREYCIVGNLRWREPTVPFPTLPFRSRGVAGGTAVPLQRFPYDPSLTRTGGSQGGR
jgi:hypothetical protein